ncbi:Bromodomain-containing protein [Quillaja saponaria]|uniref:Bromodomain-containing protein n=1 Tax=Quillaja saponaria TaxID=32244 RepID=A0AAD7LII5_QUISA|nr:Bromodomain-containing protein [Quillaja saponaria]
MGEVPETMTKKKKKKGRPSLLDLQKRSLKQLQQQQNPKSIDSTPNPSHRITGRNSTPDPTHQSPEWIAADDDDDERKKKKHKLLLGLNPHHPYPTLSANSVSLNSGSCGSDSNQDGDDPEANHKRRRANANFYGSDQTVGELPKATDNKQGSQVESGPTTPLPDKKLLLFILDRLQKKDTHGVFSEPVDSHELPDYHEIIEHPMDFSTVRKKLDGGAYANLEQFEKDVFLICSNAMQYNAPDTVYFRQARSMQELAKKDFENLRQESDDSEPQPRIVRRGRPPGKNLKKSVGRPPLEHAGPESSSDATFASGVDNAGGSNTYSLRKKFQPADASIRISQTNVNSGSHPSWVYEWENEFPASVLKADLKYGKKHFALDETRRDTYKNPLSYGRVPPILATIEGEVKQIMPVGLHLENSYARSLARFAADLGPVVREIAAKKIGSILPNENGFGPGFLGENEVSLGPQFSVCNERSLDCFVPEEHRNRLLSQRTTGSFSLANNFYSQSGDSVTTKSSEPQNELTSIDNSGRWTEPVFPFKIQRESVVHSDNYGLKGGLSTNVSPQMKMVRLTELTGFPSSTESTQVHDLVPVSNPATFAVPSNIIQSLNNPNSNNLSTPLSGSSLAIESSIEPHRLARVGVVERGYRQGLPMQPKQNFFSFHTDLNKEIRATNSPTSHVQTGSPQQPDLALQL